MRSFFRPNSTSAQPIPTKVNETQGVSEAARTHISGLATESHSNTLAESHSNTVITQRRTENTALATAVVLPQISRGQTISLSANPRALEKRKAIDEIDNRTKKKGPAGSPAEVQENSPPLTTAPGIIYRSGEITARGVIWAESSHEKHVIEKQARGEQVPSRELVSSIGNSPASKNRPAYIYKNTSYVESMSRSEEPQIASHAGDILRGDIKRGIIVAIHPPSNAKTGFFVIGKNNIKNKHLTEKVFLQKLKRDQEHK